MQDMKIFRMMTLALSLFAAGAFALQAQPNVEAAGGVFRKVADPEEGEMARSGQISVIFDGSGNVWFEIKLDRADGVTAQFGTENGEWIPAEGSRFRRSLRSDVLDYTFEANLVSADKLVITENFGAGGSPFEKGMTLMGEYERLGAYVPDTKGFMYRYVSEATELELCAGGRYAGTVQVPETVSVQGKDLRVAGIAEKAFWGNKAVTEVVWDHGTQYVGPSAFYRSGMHYYWESGYSLPGYIYPSNDFMLFVRQEEVYDWDQNSPLWMFFKHNYAPLTFIKDRLKDESARWGYNPMLADQMQGVYYEMRVPSAVKKDMFRGYEAFEVIGLVMGGRFAAFHRFPPFSRWKGGEKEQQMSASLVKAVETRYGRKVFQSRYIGHLREEDGRVGIFELEPKDGEAMIVIAWTQGGKLKATYVKTTELDPSYGEGSTWNVDDDGTYGIPDLLCVAFDLHDNVILWFNHGAPESKNLFGLRQQGDQLQPFSEEQWYVYVD